ncbi:MAG: hypothetical protein P4L75_00705 [Clostridia bacterium]|nr:hypothetical protein [Clostridia bacterium]
MKQKSTLNRKSPAFWAIAVVAVAALAVACGMAASRNLSTGRQAVGAAIRSGGIVYQNTVYGFDFALPESWKGYTIVTQEWEGIDSQSGKTVETGPILLIRNPGWSSRSPRQDIPIMVFTLSQWGSLQRDEFHIGAAPVGPTELGRNSKYVFSLPARYNFAFLPGYEEVEKILAGKPLKPTEAFSMGD